MNHHPCLKYLNFMLILFVTSFLVFTKMAFKLAFFLCYLSYLGAFEQELDVPYNSLIPVNVNFTLEKL